MATTRRATEPAAPTIQVLDRSIAILRQIADSDQPLNANELAQVCKLNRTTAWRILVTLETNEIVDRDPFTQRYTISPELGRLAAPASSGRLLRSSRNVLQELANHTGEQVSLGVPNPFGFTFIDHVQPDSTHQISRWLGPSGPLHASASGKVFLAFLPDDERAEILAEPLEKFTPKTQTQPARLESHIARVTAEGFAMSFGEHDPLTSAVCAPVTDPRGRLVAVVDLWGPSQRLSQKRMHEVGPRVRKAAETIAHRLSASQMVR